MRDSRVGAAPGVVRPAVAVLAVAVLAGVGACAGQGGAGGGPWGPLPSAYDRWCGHRAGELLPDGAPATLTVDPPTDLTADAPWRVRTTLDVPVPASGRVGSATPEPVPETHAIVYGTDVALVRDGRVVAVQAGRAAPSVHEVVSSPSRVDYAAPALPFTEEVTGTFVACHGTTLGGDYELVVTDTVSLLAPSTSPGASAGASPDPVVPGGGTPEATPSAAPVAASSVPPTTPALPEWPTLDGAPVARVGGSVPVQVARATSGSPVPLPTVTSAPAPTPTGTDPAVCGAPTTGLRALAAAPVPIAVGLTTPGLAPATSGEPYEIGQTLTNTGTTHLDLATGHPTVLVTRDGRVVGGPGEAMDAIGIVVQLRPGERDDAAGLAAWTMLRACGTDDPAALGEPLPAGHYEVWTLWSFTPTSVGPPKRIPETPAADGAEAAGGGGGAGSGGVAPGSPGSATSPDGAATGAFVAVGGPWPLTIG